MNIPTEAIVMTVVLIAGFIYFKIKCKKNIRNLKEYNQIMAL